ncbi:MAG: hypothetical protein ACRBCK_09195 [Alphaproteobacteria bacterium]
MSLIEPDLHLQKPLEDYCESLEKLNRRSLPVLTSLYSPLISYSDPYHTAQGLEVIEALWMRKINLCGGVDYRVHDFMWGRRAATANIVWSCCYSLRRKRLLKRDEEDRCVIEGVSELVFDMDGKILSNTEFWGKHSHFDIKAYSLPHSSKG